jgi:hypothetical protein
LNTVGLDGPHPQQRFYWHAFSKWLPALDDLRIWRMEVPRACRRAVGKSSARLAPLVLRSAYWLACSRASAFCAWVKSGLMRNACL